MHITPTSPSFSRFHRTSCAHLTSRGVPPHARGVGQREVLQSDFLGPIHFSDSYRRYAVLSTETMAYIDVPSYLVSMRERLGKCDVTWAALLPGVLLISSMAALGRARAATCTVWGESAPRHATETRYGRRDSRASVWTLGHSEECIRWILHCPSSPATHALPRVRSCSRVDSKQSL